VNQEETLFAINSDLPHVPCKEGCVDCCSIAFWSPFEWSRVPEELLEKVKPIGSVNVPMRVFGGEKVLALLPVHRQRVMEIANRKKMAVTEWTSDQGLLLKSVGMEGLSCIFKEEGKGCMVYEYRPFICRVMGTSITADRLICPDGILPDKPLPDFSLKKRFAMWVSLFPPQHTPKEVKN
jgi:Fe-S-cluster containining protein